MRGPLRAPRADAVPSPPPPPNPPAHQACDACETKFAYASTLCIYVYDRPSQQLEQILVGHGNNIMCLRFHPQNDNLLLSCSQDRELKTWDVGQGKVLHRSNHRGDKMFMCAWDFSRPHEEVVLYSMDNCLYSLVVNVGSARAVKKFESPIVTFAQSEKLPHLTAVGTLEGNLYVLNRTTNRTEKVAYPSPVVDIEWDRLSPSYFLVMLQSGEHFLRCGEQGMELFKFQKQTTGKGLLRWVPDAPGSFISVSEKTGIIKSWNASQAAPLSSVKTAQPGIVSVRFFPKSKEALCVFQGGVVGIYNVEHRTFAWQSSGGHTETIFANKFKSTDCNVLATASYDGTIRLWDVRSGKCLKKMEGAGGVLYSVTWSPDGDYLAASSSTGDIFIFSEAKGTVIRKVSHHKGPSLSVTWHPEDNNTLASSAEDGNLCIFSPEGVLIRKFSHPSKIYCSAWSPQNRELIATACANGYIYVWDLSFSKEAPKPTVLKGHKAKCFNVAWNPILPNVLLSSSDDCTAIVWDTVAGAAKCVLRGHNSKVRAVAWHPEIPYLALTGSWDTSICGWDTRDGSVLFTSKHHVSDVYAIDLHPDRPFLFASSSRDSTVRLSTLQSLVPDLHLKYLFGNRETLGGAAEGGPPPGPSSSGPITLQGQQSLKLLDNLAECQSDLEKINAVADFFALTKNTDNLFRLARIVDGEDCSCSEGPVVHSREVLPNLNAKANEMEQHRSLRVRGMSGIKKEDALKEAALLHLKAGNVEAYCEIMIELGEWERALVVAPALGIGYWSSLMQKRMAAAPAGERITNDLLPLYLANNSVDELSAIYVANHKYQEAFEVLSVEEAGGYKELATAKAKAEQRQAKADGKGPAAGLPGHGGPLPLLKRPSLLAPLPALQGLQLNGGASTSGAPPAPEGLRRVQRLQADQYRGAADPVAAACSHLAANDRHQAIVELILANEIELAYGLTEEGPQKTVVRRLLAEQCEHLRLWREAADLLKSIGDQESLELLACRFSGTSDEINTFYQHVGLAMPKFQGNGPAKADGVAQARALLLSRNQKESVQHIVTKLKAILAKRVWSMEEVEPYVCILTSCSLRGLESTLKNEALVYLLYLGGLKAIWLSYSTIVPFLLDKCINLIRSGVPFPIDISVIRLQKLSFLDTASESSMEAEFSKLLKDAPPPLRDVAAQKLEEMKGRKALGAQPNVVPHISLFFGSKLPSGTITVRSRSVLDGKYIIGQRVALDDGSSVSAMQAVQLQRVFPLNPTLSGAPLRYS